MTVSGARLQQIARVGERLRPWAQLRAERSAAGHDPNPAAHYDVVDP